MDILSALRNLRRDRAAGVAAPIANAQTQVVGPAAGSLADLQKSAAAMKGLDTASVGATGARASNVGEMIERQAAKEQLGDVAKEANLAEEVARQREENIRSSFELGQKDAQLSYVSLAERAAAERSRLLESARQAKEQGRLARAKAAVDQANFLRRLSDDKYIQTLQEGAALKRLNTKQGFEQALAEDVMGAELDLLKGKLTWEEAMNADENAFDEKMAALDFTMAMELAEGKMKSDMATSGFTGLGAMTAGAAQGYQTYKDSGGGDDRYQKWADAEEGPRGYRPDYNEYKKSEAWKQGQGKAAK
jgi:hypothetical protein